MTTYPYTITRDITQPPGGWTMTVAQTGFVLRAASAHALVTKVKAHLKANGLVIQPDFEAWVRNEICVQMNLGSPFCGPVKPRKTGSLPFLTRGRASRFLRTVMGAIRDRQFVPRDEAERRIAICMKCPLATSLGGCLGCDSAFIVAGRLLKMNPIVAEKGKEFCGACGCYLTAKILIENSTLDNAERGDKPPYAEGCWRLG